MNEAKKRKFHTPEVKAKVALEALRGVKTLNEIGFLPMISELFRIRYRDLLHAAENECLASDTTDKTGKRGKVARSKARNLLERLKNFEADVLQLIDNAIVLFSNNQAENDLCMIKVEQKVSGCFRSMDGTKKNTNCSLQLWAFV